MTNSPKVVAVYNIDDDTLRLSISHAERFPSQLLADAKAAGFRHWRASKQLVGTWTPEREDFALEQASEIMDTLIPHDPTARIDRYKRYGQWADSRADQRRKAAIRGLPPMGEPIKTDHHSARKHQRAIKRSQQNMRAAFADMSKVEYWAEKAKAAERHARMKSIPSTIRNRIKTLQSELRSHERRHVATASEAASPRHMQHERWITHLQARIAFEQARLLEIEPQAPAAPKFEVGEVVWWNKFGRCEIVGIGPKNCRVKVLDGGARGLELRVARDELTLPK